MTEPEWLAAGAANAGGITHQPEPSQWALSNGEFLEHGVSELTIAALSAITSEIERVMWNRTQQEFRIGWGESFSTPIFTMRGYCWCDGDLHDDYCPPNFEWRDIQINWYKHLGRGMSANRDIDPNTVAVMLDECLAAVREMDDIPAGI